MLPTLDMLVLFRKMHVFISFSLKHFVGAVIFTANTECPNLHVLMDLEGGSLFPVLVVQASTVWLFPA